MKKTKRTAKTPPPAVSTTPAPGALVPQPHGGAIRQHGNPGNKGGGRHPDFVREQLKNIVENGATIAEQIVAGKPVQKTRIRIADLVPHLHCPKCGDVLEAKKGAGKIEITAHVSASPKDRIGALDFAAKYSIGQKNELTVVSPDIQARLARQVEVTTRVLKDHPDLLEKLLKSLGDEVWV